MLHGGEVNPQFKGTAGVGGMGGLALSAIINPSLETNSLANIENL